MHSCERGTLCKAVETAKNIVWITPILCRSEKGVALPEFQVNGKGRDLAQLHELDPFDVRAANGLIAMCTKEACDFEFRSKVADLISKMHDSRDKALPLNDLNLHLEDETIPLPRFACLLKDIVHKEARQERHSAACDTIPCDQTESRETPLEQNIVRPQNRNSLTN